MIAQAFVRQFAAGQKIDLDVADQEVVLHYALARLNENGLVGYPPGEQTPGPLLFKGGTALRKFIFGSTGRFSQDIDLDATHKNGFEETVEAAFQPAQPYYGIEFSLPVSATPATTTSAAPSSTTTPTARAPSSCRSPTAWTRSWSQST